MKTQAKFTFDKINFDQDNDVHLVISLNAPKMEEQKKRPPVCITLVADVSGSMGGNKLDYAKRSMLKLIDHLQKGDFCGLVSFGSQAFGISAPVEMTQVHKDELKTKVGDLYAMGGTNFSGGMLSGLDYANKVDLPNEIVNRIIMFTDGCANEGVAKTSDDITNLLAKNLGKATLSAFGYGSDADQVLLENVAKTGKGNYAFIQNPDDAISAFAKELGGLLSTYAQNVEVRIQSKNDHKILEVVSDVDVTDDKGIVVIKLPDLMFEEERNLVLFMKLAKQKQALPRDMTVIDMIVSYDLITETGVKVRKETKQKAKIRFVKSGDQQVKATQEVDAIVALAQLVKMQIEAESKANAGDYAGAKNSMSVFSSNLTSRGHANLSTTSSKIADKMASQHQYSASSGYLRSTKLGATRGYGVSSVDAEASVDLSNLGVQLNNSSQTAYTASFHQPTNVQQVDGLTGGVVVGSITGAVTGAINIGAPAFTGLIHMTSGPCVCAACIKPIFQVDESKPSKKPSKLDKQRSKRW